MFLALEIFFELYSSKFWTGIIKLSPVLSIVQNFTSVGLRISEISREKNLKKLKIWGKAQREFARRSKSDWGEIRGGSKISPTSKSRGLNSNALAYAERALSIEGWST